ncbi:cytochrome P450 [Mycena vulgaris]|nr:cytochrome P450 [Mycena vulgaris]
MDLTSLCRDQSSGGYPWTGKFSPHTRNHAQCSYSGGDIAAIPPLPPGPTGNLLTGIKAKLPRSEPWRTYAAWGAHYGSPLLSFRVYNRLTIVLNTHTAVHELLERRAGIYSGRPISWMFQVICGRANARGLSANAVKGYSPILEDEVEILIRGLRDTPDHFEQHLRRNTAAAIMKVAFGYSITGAQDHFISGTIIKDFWMGNVAGRWLVDYYPILRFIPSWFPLAHFKRQGAEWRSILDSISEVPHVWVKSQMLMHPGMSKDEEDIVKWCAGALYAGAADTTVSATLSFIMLMALHPAIQAQAQAEIDSITSGGPRVSDLSRLPYLTAVMKEVMRYAPVANMALPHQVSQEDTYAGYRLPAGSSVIPNVWAILHDPDLYPDPFLFDPERFIRISLSSPTRISTRPDQPDPGAYCWGFGRRTCPGRPQSVSSGIQFAQPALLLSMACILYHFTISPVSWEAAKVGFTSGITSHIKPFEIHFTGRRGPGVNCTYITKSLCRIGISSGPRWWKGSAYSDGIPKTS